MGVVRAVQQDLRQGIIGLEATVQLVDQAGCGHRPGGGGFRPGRQFAGQHGVRFQGEELVAVQADKLLQQLASVRSSLAPLTEKAAR